MKGRGSAPVHVVLGVEDPALLADALWGEVGDGAEQAVHAQVLGVGEPVALGQPEVGDLQQSTGRRLSRLRSASRTAARTLPRDPQSPPQEPQLRAWPVLPRAGGTVAREEPGPEPLRACTFRKRPMASEMPKAATPSSAGTRAPQRETAHPAQGGSRAGHFRSQTTRGKRGLPGPELRQASYAPRQLGRRASGSKFFKRDGASAAL